MTIKDIARISGCSVSTISRVINDRPDVRPETKEHVLKVMREAGFTPNTNARQLKIQQSRSLVFVVKGTRNIFFSDFLVQLQRAATLYGYNGIVSYLDENANEIDAAQKILREIKPKGMIFLGGSVANFQQGFANITVPSVLTTLVSDELDFPNLSMVGVDDRAAARTAVDEQKIVRPIVRKPVFSVVRLVGVVGHIMPAALVDAAGHLAQAVHHGILCQREAPAPVWFCGEVRHCGGGRLHRQHDAFGGQRAAKRKTLDHGKNSLSPKNQKPFCTFILRQALPENKRQNRHVFATKPS